MCRAVNTRPTSQKIWGSFLYGVYRSGKWLWIESSGKNGKTPHKGIIWQYISVDLYSLRSYGALKSQDIEKFSNFWGFVEKNDPLRENFQKSVPKEFIATPADLLCSNFVKFGRREIDKIVCCLPDKKNKISHGCPALATARIAPKIYQGQPPRMCSECFRFHPNRLTFDGVIPERVNTVKTRSKLNPRFGCGLTSLASSRIIRPSASGYYITHGAYNKKILLRLRTR